jgi:hypothetical protein
MTLALAQMGWGTLSAALGLILGLIFILVGVGLGAIAIAEARPKQQKIHGAGAAAGTLSPRDRWRVVGYGGLGGLAGYSLFQGLLGKHGLFTHPELVETVVLFLALPLAVWVEIKLVHPRMERRSALRGETPHHPELVLWRWTARGTPALIMTVSFTELFLTFSHRDFGWTGAMVLCGAVTWLWISGAQAGRWRSGLLGGVGGWALGMAGAGALICGTWSRWVPEGLRSAGYALSGREAGALMFRAILVFLGGGVLCAAMGAAAGLLLGRLSRVRPAKRRAAVLGALGGSALCMFSLAVGSALVYGGPRPDPARETPLNELSLLGHESEPAPVDGFGEGTLLSAEEFRTSLFGVILLGILGEGILWAALGGGGGLWLDHASGRRPLAGLLVALLAATLLYDAATFAAWAGWLGGLGIGRDLLGALPLGDLLRDFGKDVARTLGWGVGLMLCPSSIPALGGLPTDEAR